MDWNSSILWGIIGIISGGIISFVFFVKGNKTKRLTYRVDSTPIISNKLGKIKGLDIAFRGDKVPNLNSTNITMVNNGTDIIEPHDFAEIDPLMLKTDGKFLVYDDVDSFITKVSNQTSSTKLKLDSNEAISINFDYWKPGDTIILTLLHTDELFVSGTIKRGKLIKSSAIDKSGIISTVVCGICLFFLIFLGLLVQGINSSVIFLLNALIYLLIGYILIGYAIKKLRDLHIKQGNIISNNNIQDLKIISQNNIDDMTRK